MGKSLTKAEKLLLAAADLEQRGVRPFSAEDLVIAAWRKYPDAFALQGYPQHPDSNRIYAEIMGSKPLRRHGWIVKTGEKRYQLSNAGRLASESLGWVGDSREGSRADLRREQKLLLGKLLSSRAVQKARADNVGAIIFPDACAFWDISPRSVAKTLQARLESVEAVLAVAEEIIREKGALAFTHGGAPIGADDIQLMRDSHNLLLEKFAEELEVIRARNDERLTR